MAGAAKHCPRSSEHCRFSTTIGLQEQYGQITARNNVNTVTISGARGETKCLQPTKPSHLRFTSTLTYFFTSFFCSPQEHLWTGTISRNLQDSPRNPANLKKFNLPQSPRSGESRIKCFNCTKATFKNNSFKAKIFSSTLWLWLIYNNQSLGLFCLLENNCSSIIYATIDDVISLKSTQWWESELVSTWLKML